MSNWKRVSIDEVCDIRRGSSPRPIVQYLSDEGMPWIKISDATDSLGRYINKTEQFIKHEGVSRSVLVKPGDLILSNSGTAGLPKFVGIEACIHDGWQMLSNFRNVTSEFMYYQLLYIRPRLLHLGYDSSMKNLTLDMVRNFMIELPPLKEQDSITDILLSFDNKMEVNNKISQELEIITQSLYKHWFVDYEFPDDNDEPYKSSGGEMVETEEGYLPIGWKTILLDEHLNFLRGIEPGSKNYQDEETSENIPFYRVGDMIDNVGVKYIDLDLAKDRTFEEKNVLVSFDGAIGRIMTGNKGAYSTGMRKVYSKKGIFTDDYIYVLFQSPNIQNTIEQYANGTTILHASSSIKHLKTVYNKEIVEKFNKIIEPMINKIRAIKKENDELAEIRDLMIQKLMSGEIRIPEKED